MNGIFDLKMGDLKTVEVAPDEMRPLQEISKRTFYETFSGSNTESDMQKYLDESFAVSKLESEHSDPNSKFYFAKLGGNVVGYLKVNFGQSQTELKDEKSLEIERIYVLSEFHGKKVGQALYDQAIQLAVRRNLEYVWLGVWEENPRAIAFYKKNGFVEFDKHVFMLGEDEQTDVLMKLVL